jgi:hypothetical protein
LQLQLNVNCCTCKSLATVQPLAITFEIFELLRLQITGNYNGANGDESMLPNFYGLFCNGTRGHNKPMIIGEVSHRGN